MTTYLKNIETGDYETCFASEDKKHRPDWNTLSSEETGGHDKVVAVAGKPLVHEPTVFDVWCSACGLSGTIREGEVLLEESVQWA